MHRPLRIAPADAVPVVESWLITLVASGLLCAAQQRPGGGWTVLRQPAGEPEILPNADTALAFIAGL